MNLTYSHPKKFFIFLTLLCVCSSDAEQISPIYIANQNPFIQIFGLPRAEPGTLTPKGKLDAGFLYYASNNAISADTSDGETITWDGETALYNLKLRYGILDSLEFGVDLPFIQQSGGYMDSLIRHTHDFLGMPNDRQESFGNNEIHYRVRDKGSTLYELAEKKSGIGDIRFSAAMPLFASAINSERYFALRSQLKLPTGDADYLLGSGGTDVSMTLSYSDNETLNFLNTVFSAHAGVIYLGNSDVLRNKQRHYAGYGGVSLGWQALKYIQLKLQLDMHSAFYDSGLSQLGSSIQLLAGGTAQLPGDVFLDLGMSQNMATDATPDVGFYLLLRRLF